MQRKEDKFFYKIVKLLNKKGVCWMKNDKMLKTVQFIIIISLPFLTDYYLPLKEIIKPPYTYIGILIILVGIYISVKTSLIFRQANNSFTLKGESSKLVTDDVFSFSRNPMY